MQVDPRRFLELTLLIAASACGAAATPETPRAAKLEPALPPPPAPPELPVTTETTTASEPQIVAETPSCNDDGDVGMCRLLMPTCESGAANACGDFVTARLRPKIVQGFAECVAKRQKGGRCPPASAPRACMKAVVQKGCVDPAAEAICRDLVASCNGAGKKPKFTVEACAQVVSAVRAKPGTPEWNDAGLDLLGPSAENGSCTLHYALPYNPFAPW